MARTNTAAIWDQPRRDPAPDWQRSHGTSITGQAYVDEADKLAAEAEAKWGADRLRLLVSPELRAKFDRQRYLLNQAIWHGDLEAVRRESERMATAWQVLDRAAEHAGADPLDPMVWEIPLKDGSVAALVPDSSHAHRVVASGRKVKVYTLEEIARLIDGFPALSEAKLIFPGATITAVRRSIPDPIDGIADTSHPIDDPLPF